MFDLEIPNNQDLKPPVNKGSQFSRLVFSGFFMVVGQLKGKYNRLVFRFDMADQTYDVREVLDIQPTGLNFVTLDSGVCVSITEDEKLEAFSNRKNSSTIKVVDDPVVGGDMKLAKHAGSVIVAKGNKVYRMRMK